MEEEWIGDTARQIERLLGDPMGQAVRGTVTVLSASPRTARPNYQECIVEVRAEAPGMDPTIVRTTGVFGRAHWPVAGTVFRADIPPQKPSVLDVDWEAHVRRA